MLAIASEAGNCDSAACKLGNARHGDGLQKVDGTMTTENEICTDAQSLVEQLSDAARTVYKNDLGGLAKMHSWCEALVDGAGQSSSQRASSVSEAAQAIIELLEALILGEAEDPIATLSSIAEAVAGLVILTGADDLVEELTSPEAQTQSEPDIEMSTPDSAQVTPRNDAAIAKVVPPQSVIAEAEVDSAPVDTKPAAADACEEKQPSSEIPPYEQVPLVVDDNEHEFINGFLEEAGEHIEAIEAALLEVEQAPEDSTHVDNLFRPFHTIKGIAGFLNLRDINCLTHEVETIMDQVRKGKRTITPGLIDLAFDVVDILKVQLSAIATYLAEGKGGTIPQPPIVEMIEKLRAVSAGRLTPDAREPTAGSPDKMVGENLVEQGVCSKEVVDIALDAQKKESEGKKTGEILVDMRVATRKQVSQAIRPRAQEKAGAQAGGASDRSVRIDTGKLDGLVDMVGELVIAQTLVGAAPSVASDAKLTKDVSQVGKIVRDVQELAMSMRMIPIGPTFQKMARLVRDVSRKATKQVELTISGEDTELDKNVIQQIGDPLVHMVRNAVDHGVEPSDVRRAAGKDEKGNVHLSAYHQGGNIVIEIADDGKGLDPKKLIAKGIERGIVQPGEELTDQEAFSLIFAPGFSMAQKVTDISGRGVGMDVVRRNIEKLRGKVDISSEIGKGSTFNIRLPLTLAIIDGMVIQLGNERFIIPTIAIEQALRPLPAQITTVQNKGEVLNVRGRLIPLVQLGALFRLTGRIDPCEAMVVIAHCEGSQIGLVVNKLIGQQQVVIKSLGERFEGLKGVAGAAILGDGRVGLILEMTGLATAHARFVTPQVISRESVIHASPKNTTVAGEIPGPDVRAIIQDEADRQEPSLVSV